MCVVRQTIPRPKARLVPVETGIERWRQTLKNRILLENDFLPGDLEARIAAFVEHYNHRRTARR